MRTLRFCALALAACSSHDLPKAAACDIAAPEAGVLRADGTDLVDANGRTVFLRGINAGGRAKYAPYAPFTFDPGGYDAALAAYLDRPAAWGFDVLRVPFSWAAAEPAPGEWDEDYLGRYDALLDAAYARGMWTIVDFHQDLYAEPLCGDGFPAWTLDDPGEPRHDCEGWFTKYAGDDEVSGAFDRFWSDETGVRTAFAAMWDRMSARHADRPGVIGFEIINEPYKGTLPAREWEEEVLPGLYAEITDVIRANAPDALVFLDVAGTAALTLDTRLVLPERPNLVFAPHFYDPVALFGTGSTTLDPMDSLATWRATADGWGVPMLLGEMGIDGEHWQAEEHARNHMLALDALQTHGTWWEYSDAPDLWNFEDLSVVDTDGNEREPMLDGLVRPYVKAVAGAVVSQSFDPETGVYDLELVPEGTTEVMLPDRIYGDEVEVRSDFACSARAGRTLIVDAATTHPVRIRVTPR